MADSRTTPSTPTPLARAAERARDLASWTPLRPAGDPLLAGAGPLRLPRALDLRLRRWAIEGYPEESCGVLVGRETPAGTRVRRALRLGNVSPERRVDRYVLDPEGLVRADTAARASGLEIVGFWHTHPDHPARPSRTDLDAAWEAYTYLILSVDGAGATRATAWRLEDGAFHEQAIVLEPATRGGYGAIREALR
jgi:proteasome lid subunit RPN8/RPN11